MMNVSGKIVFASAEVPEEIPNGSLLTVKVQDTNMMDAPAVLLGEYKTIIQNYNKGDSLTYEIKNASLPSYKRATLHAVLNIGWQASGNEWIRQGDYLNDTTHPIEIEDDKNEYFGCDINVVHYI
ncbi:uncharacterized protein LOC100211495 isoform X1 [Hydra vulgaris]|uniref:uncharacterized protein LOC100211495 isoform X1 n=1 Tax=Hydra vulgaris TaxID=6087 RepID=UPI0001927129|nr:uncharacterized protein LOC100211495 [Hydra vulgaris]